MSSATVQEMPSALGKALKDEREKRGLSQAKFARLLGARKRTYEKWETTEREPENAGVIWRALRCLREHGSE